MNKGVIVYVDGFNLYFGMLQAGFDYCKWLDLILLSNNLLKSNQVLIEVKNLGDMCKVKRLQYFLSDNSDPKIECVLVLKSIINKNSELERLLAKIETF